MGSALSQGPFFFCLFFFFFGGGGVSFFSGAVLYRGSKKGPEFREPPTSSKPKLKITRATLLKAHKALDATREAQVLHLETLNILQL